MKETMTLPAGYKMVQEAATASAEGSVAHSSGSLSQTGNKLRAERKISLGKRVYEAADWGEFREAVNAYKAIANNMLVFEKR